MRLCLFLAICIGTALSEADISAAEDAPLTALVGLLAEVDDPSVQTDILLGLQTALRGRRDLSPPEGWSDIARKLARSPDATVRWLSRGLSLLFRDKEILADMRILAADGQADAERRRQAIEDLASIRDADLLPIVRRLVRENNLRGPALRALAVYGDPETPQLVLQHYVNYTRAERQAAVDTLASRPEFAVALVKAIQAGRIPSRDVSTFVARQLAAYEHPEIDRLLPEVWGSVRPTAAAKSKLIQEQLKNLTPERLAAADLSQGRLVFEKTCAGCHLLFGAGRKVGPDLTGSQRSKTEYVLENLLDPNALIGRDYRLTTFATDAGRVIAGLVKEETENSLTVQTATEDLVLSKDEIVAQKSSNVSMMPEGLIEKLTAEQVRDLVAYLAAPGQVPLPETD